MIAGITCVTLAVGNGETLGKECQQLLLLLSDEVRVEE